MGSDDKLVEVYEVIFVLVESWKYQVWYNFSIFRWKTNREHLKDLVPRQNSRGTIHQELSEPFSDVFFIEFRVLD